MNTSVRVASTANLTAATAEVGQTVDGVVLGPHDRLLLKDQTRAYENGIYEVQAAGSGIFVRASDAESFTAGTTVVVNEGTANQDKAFVLLGVDPIRVGADDLVFAEPVVSESSVTGLVAGLAAKVPATRTIATVAPLTGGGDLSANRTLTFSPTVVSKSANYTALTTDSLILCTAGVAGFTLTLYPATGNSGKMLMAKKVDAGIGSVTIDANGAETIDGAATTALVAQYAATLLMCDGSNWHRLSFI